MIELTSNSQHTTHVQCPPAGESRSQLPTNMDPKRVNEFLPPSSASATPADRMDAPMEDDFDVAQYRALKKDKQEEQKRLDHEHDLRHRHLEEQVHQENSRLYAQLQQRVNESIQRAFIDLQPAIAATINSQVSLRLEQQRLRDEHAASRNTIEQRYHNKITGLMAMPSAARTAIPRVNSNSSTPSRPPPNNIRVSTTLAKKFSYKEILVQRNSRDRDDY